MCPRNRSRLLNMRVTPVRVDDLLDGKLVFLGKFEIPLVVGRTAITAPSP